MMKALRTKDDALVAEMGGLTVDDLQHARHVARLAQDLFHLSEPLHDFGRREATLLRRAALLHDCGILVSYHSHHKESLRLIKHATLPGIAPAEQMEIACIARYHRKALPQRRHRVYRHLSRVAQQRVNVLGGILRLADAFDYEHNSGIDKLTGHIISTPGKMDQVLIQMHHHIADNVVLAHIIERAKMKRNLFEREFNCRITIIPLFDPVQPPEHSPLAHVPANGVGVGMHWN